MARRISRKSRSPCPAIAPWRQLDLTQANLGLNKYKVLRDGRNTITLLRSVGQLGDRGLLPAPEAQCLGVHTARMELILSHQPLFSFRLYINLALNLRRVNPRPLN